MSILFVVQVSYFAWTTTAGIKFSKYDNIKEIIDQALELCFLILKWWSLLTDNVRTHEETIGRLMVVVVFIYFLNNLIFVLALIIKCIAEVRKHLQSKKDKPSSRHEYCIEEIPLRNTDK